MRVGAHLSEALGRAVERVVATQLDIQRLRTDYPIRTEHAGRRVCDGLAVIAQLKTDATALALSANVLAGLTTLADAIDVYGDLLVADAVFDVVSGRSAEAAQSLDAAAGLASPPELDVIRTQRRGRGITTAVVMALPAAAAVATVDATTSPGRIAEPSAAAWLDTAFGPATGPAWTWLVSDPDGVTVTTVTLADLGLAPMDTAQVSASALARTALEASGTPDGATVFPAGEFPPPGGRPSAGRARRPAGDCSQPRPGRG